MTDRQLVTMNTEGQRCSSWTAYRVGERISLLPSTLGAGVGVDGDIAVTEASALDGSRLRQSQRSTTSLPTVCSLRRGRLHTRPIIHENKRYSGEIYASRFDWLTNHQELDKQPNH